MSHPERASVVIVGDASKAADELSAAGIGEVEIVTDDELSAEAA